MIKKLHFVLFFVLFFTLCGNLQAQWRGGEGRGRVGTGLRDAPNSNSGVWYATGLLDWIFVEDLAKGRAQANGHPNRYNDYLYRFMPEPQPILLPPVIPIPMPNPVQPPLQVPVLPQRNFDYLYWTNLTGIYKPGKTTEGNNSLSENGRYNNPYREIRFVKILYRGPAEKDSYNAAVREVLNICRDKDQTYEHGADYKFFVSPSKDVGPNRKFIFAWGDDISGTIGFVVVESVENGRIICLLNNGQKRIAIDNPTNFYDWYLGSYRGKISEPSVRGARLAYVPEGKRNIFASIQLWMHQGNIAACFRLRDLQE